jgi:hypothetical protein
MNFDKLRKLETYFMMQSLYLALCSYVLPVDKKNPFAYMKPVY